MIERKKKRSRRNRRIMLVLVVILMVSTAIFYGMQSLSTNRTTFIKSPIDMSQALEKYFADAEPLEGLIEDYKLNLATITRRDHSFFSDEHQVKREDFISSVETSLASFEMDEAESAINSLAFLYDSYSMTGSGGEMTYARGILIANKKYCMPYDFEPGEDLQAKTKMSEMLAAAGEAGLYLTDFSTYRSAYLQEDLFNRYAASDGVDAADRYSSRPGCSDHQTGLAFDIGGTNKGHWAETSFDGTPEANWLEEHAHEHGFILRYPQGKEEITGYMYESWHYRYVGDIAPKVKKSGLALEEYLEIL